MDVDQFTSDVQAAITSIKERIELANWQDYKCLVDVERETETLLSAVVCVDDDLPVGVGEIIIGAIPSILKSIQEFKDVCYTSHLRGRPQIPIKQ